VTLGLSPLSDEDTARLVSALLERSLMPAETQAALLERAGGNPLYAEQFVRMLGEADSAAGPELPETVQALIAARLDTLAPELKGLLQDASVLGKVFWTGALAAMGDRPRDALLAGLRELVRREFVRPARVSSMHDEEEFSFWHVLVRDVAYQQIPRAARGQKHVQAAEWIELASEGRVADHSEFLAHHYAQALELGRAAGDVEDAAELEQRLVRFSVLAGDRAMSLDIPAAESAYRRALAVMHGRAERGPVLVKLGDALQPLGRLVESVAAYEEAIAALLAAGDEQSAGLAMVNLGRVLWRHGDTHRALEVSTRAVALLEGHRDPALVLAYGRIAALDALGGRSRRAIEWADKAIALASAIGFENVSRPLGMRGIARLDLGDRGGLEDMRAALDVALELGLPVEDTAVAYTNLGETESLDGLAKGRPLLEAGLDLARSRGHTHHVMVSRGYLNWFWFHEGRWDELIESAGDLIERDRARGATQIEVFALTDSARVLVHREQASRAADFVDAALPRARHIGDPQVLLPTLATAALVAIARGDRAAADELLTEHEDRSGVHSVRVEDDLVWLMIVAVSLGDLSRAEALLTRHEPGSACARHAFAHGRALVAEASGRPEEAAKLFAEAADGWKVWGSVPFRGYALLGVGRCAGGEEARAEGEAIFARLAAVPIGASTQPARQQQV
jgi:tetratricopeptide (TPR) repeat protein